MTKNVGCPTEVTLEMISGRWKAMVIYWLLQGDRRFNQLQRDYRELPTEHCPGSSRSSRRVA